MSFLLSIPIKIAIYLKATSSLFQMLCNKSRKLLGFIPHPHTIGPNYIFIGNEKNIERCKEIAKNSEKPTASHAPQSPAVYTIEVEGKASQMGISVNKN